MQDEYVSTEHLLLAVAAEKPAMRGAYFAPTALHPRTLKRSSPRCVAVPRSPILTRRRILSHSKICPGPHRACPQRQARSRDRPRRRDQAHDPDPLASHKNNPVLIGEPGVGKTAIVEGLAQRIVSGDVPETLKNKKLVSLDLGAMLAVQSTAANSRIASRPS